MSGPRAFRSKIVEIKDDTFNMGLAKFVAQFDKSRESTAYYVQRHVGGMEGYLAAQEIRTGEEQTIDLPDPLGANPTADQTAMRAVEVANVAKLRLKLRGARRSAFSILYDQCSRKVKDKLRAEQGWDTVEDTQSTHQLVTRI